jgi:hypothetical protein
MNKVLTLSLLLILIIVAFAMVRVFHKEPAKKATVEPASSPAATTSPMTIEQYVTKNISAISPVKEQLGGTFYITDIETHGRSGAVKYEDGHNAYIADFTYTIDERGMPTIDTFAVRN